jgi:hypothetical protein
MIVYRDQLLRAESRTLLDALRSRVARLNSVTTTRPEAVVPALIEAGTLESAVVDAIFSEADGIHPLTSALRRVTVSLSHVLWHSWENAADPAHLWLSTTTERLAELEEFSFPSLVECTIPEGFAYYAVYPEAYLEAARRCWTEVRPVNVICIGLRSIGTTLSGAVAAALTELGCVVQSLSVRPRGHPFYRKPVLTWELEELIRQHTQDAHFLLIDEGPGISGSSLGGAADLLGSLGVSDERIILFSSWETDGSQLRSAQARDRWRRHRRFSISFDEMWIQSGRLSRAFPGWHWQDLSGGAWRPELYDDPQQYPPVQPQHERRKYLLRRDSVHPPHKLLSFIGLDDRSDGIIARGERLAEAGFTPRPEGAVHGFLIREFVAGSPVSPGGVDQDLLETVARYLAHLSREHPAEPTVSTASLTEMAELNVSECLGPAWQQRLAARLRGGLGSWSERSVALDGRMLPHEFIRTDAGYLKVDAFDHHCDHFFPGCQDIAWDLAGAAYELELDAEAHRCLIDRYRRLSGDQHITARLPYFALCYLAYRLGYARLATEVLGESPDKRRFTAAADRYARLLRRELMQPAGECCHG